MINARTASLTALCVHYATLTLTIHASRVHTVEEARYKASSAVLLTESGKLLVSLFLALKDLHDSRTSQSEEPPSDFSKEESSALLPSGFGLGIIEQSPEGPNLYKSRRRATSQSHASSSHSRSTSLKLVPGSPDVETRRTTYAGQFEQEADTSADYQLFDITLDVDSSFSSATSGVSPVQQLVQQVFGPKFYRLAIPAGLFALQGNLQYLAVSHLSVPTFQVISQLKILTTAIFSVILLQRRLTLQQWFSLFLLAAGVAIVQLSSLRAVNDPPTLSYSSTNTTYTHFEPPTPEMNSTLGLVAVSIMCLSSGFASTYFEKILKSLSSPSLPALPFPNLSPSEKALQDSYSRPPGLTPIILPVEEQPVSLWIRNLQLSMFGLLFSGLLCGVESSKSMWMSWINGDVGAVSLEEPNWFAGSGGFLDGFTTLTWVVVALQIIGGLLAALVMKHADNIQKNFALSLSIILSFAVSILFFNFVLVIDIVLGSALVIGATFMFNAKNQDFWKTIGLISPHQERG